jgi:hypothetical protein
VIDPTALRTVLCVLTGWLDEILRRGLSLRLTAEAGAEPIEELAQASQQRPRGPRRHDRSLRDSARQYKCNLIERRGL